MDIKTWRDDFVTEVLEAFPRRIAFVGLQGSRGRDEATEKSDIDMVVIFDELTLDDLKTYRSLVQKMPCAEQMCGFVGGRKELASWDKGELFQFYYDTIPLWGSLDDLFPKPTAEDARRSVSAGACGIYHTACHNYLFEHDYEILKSLYKGAFFVLRAKYFCETGDWIKKRCELIQVLSEEDSVILRRSMTEETVDFEEATEELILWSSRQILKYGENKS